jgi:hypothetical protein
MVIMTYAEETEGHENCKSMFISFEFLLKLYGELAGILLNTTINSP